VNATCKFDVRKLKRQHLGVRLNCLNTLSLLLRTLSLLKCNDLAGQTVCMKLSGSIAEISDVISALRRSPVKFLPRALTTGTLAPRLQHCFCRCMEATKLSASAQRSAVRQRCGYNRSEQREGSPRASRSSAPSD